MLKSNSGNIDLHEEVADSCFQYGMYDLAAKYFQYVLTECPDKDYLFKKIGAALLKNGDVPGSIEILEKAIQKTPEDIDILLDLARAYMDAKMRMRADKWATKVIRIDPSNTQAKEILDQCS